MTSKNIKRANLLIVVLHFFIGAYSQDATEDYHFRNNEAFHYFEKEEYYKCIVILDSLIVDFPNESELYYSRGYSKLLLNDYIATLFSEEWSNCKHYSHISNAAALPVSVMLIYTTGHLIHNPCFVFSHDSYHYWLHKNS